jgi:hypothetical protein
MEVTIRTLHEDMIQLKKDLDLIKRMLANEGKLTPRAKKALATARAEEEEHYTSLEAL